MQILRLYRGFFNLFQCAEIVRGAENFEESVRGAGPHSAECGRTVRGAIDHYSKGIPKWYHRWLKFYVNWTTSTY